MKKLVIGVDFGSDSSRAVVVDALTGERLGIGECEYPRWSQGLYCNPAKNIFRQHPQDYLDALKSCVKNALAMAGPEAGKSVAAMAVDTTGSTPVPVNEEGIPLSMFPEFAENPDAMFYMWKDHSSNEEAEEVNHAFASWGKEDFTRYQGRYSAEWFWAKILHAKRTAPEVCEKAVSWVEHSDWIPALLAGKTAPSVISRNATGAGHKAYWHSEYGGLPAREILEKLDPYLAYIADGYTEPKKAGTVIGTITPQWAEEFGINPDTIIGVGVFDAHAAAIGAGISPRYFVKVVGTSTVDMIIGDKDILKGKDTKDLCNQAEDTIVPGYVGTESGQAAFGDMFSWFRKVLMWSVRDFLSDMKELPEQRKQELEESYYRKMIARISKEAENLEPDPDLVVLDWFNGRRYPKNDNKAKSMFTGLHLGTTAPQIYVALSMAAVFGSRRIFDMFTATGVQMDGVIVMGGIAKKSPYIMQMLADVIKRPIHVSDDDQCSASGAAMCAATAAGFYPGILEANQAMAKGFCKTYVPNPEKAEKYEMLYQKYLALAEHQETLQSEYEQIDRNVR